MRKAKMARRKYLRQRIDPNRHVIGPVLSLYKGGAYILNPLRWFPNDDVIPEGHYLAADKYIYLPPRRRGEKFKVTYTIWVEKTF